MAIQKIRSGLLSINLQAKQNRSQSAGTLFLVCLISALIVGAGIVTYNGLSANNSQLHQTRALNAAAITAASDLGRIVIDDPNLGYVSLIERPPLAGTVLTAKDKFALPVRSVNSLLATNRLGLIIAGTINSKNAAESMVNLARQDHAYIINAEQCLVSAMQQSISAGGGVKPKDAYGNFVDAYDDALKVYRTNGGRVVDQSAFNLRLGYCSGLSSNVLIPQPESYANLGPEHPSRNCYPAFVDLPYEFLPFNFAALGNSPSLVIGAGFSSPPAGSSIVPDVIEVEGSEREQFLKCFGQAFASNIRDKAYAVPGAPPVPATSSGALVFTFPDGNLPELVSVQNLFLDSAMSSVSTKIGKPTGGDYPDSKASMLPNISIDPLGANPTASNACLLAFYDWLRRGGYWVNVDSVTSMLKAHLAPEPDTPSPFMNVFWCNSDGTISNKFLQLARHYCQSSENQPTIITVHAQGQKDSIASPKRAYVYDLLVQDNVRQLGDLSGGLHGGEPLVDTRLTDNPLYPAPNVSYGQLESGGFLYLMPGWGERAGGWAYHEWAVPLTWNVSEIQMSQIMKYAYGGDNLPETLTPQPKASQPGAQRNTYKSLGLAAEIAFHKVIIAAESYGKDNLIDRRP